MRGKSITPIQTAVEGGRAPGSVVVLRVEYAQIDNQSLHASLPIVLAPAAVREVHGSRRA